MLESHRSWRPLITRHGDHPSPLRSPRNESRSRGCSLPTLDAALSSWEQRAAEPTTDLALLKTIEAMSGRSSFSSNERERPFDSALFFDESSHRHFFALSGLLLSRDAELHFQCSPFHELHGQNPASISRPATSSRCHADISGSISELHSSGRIPLAFLLAATKTASGPGRVPSSQIRDEGR